MRRYLQRCKVFRCNNQHRVAVIIPETAKAPALVMCPLCGERVTKCFPLDVVAVDIPELPADPAANYYSVG